MAFRINSIKDLSPDLANKVTASGKTLSQELLGNVQQTPEDKAKNASKSNLGKEFETLLETTHDYYRMKNFADVHKNENEWRFTTESYVKRLLAQGKLQKACWAKTGSGSYLIMQRAMVDYAGGGQNFAVRFDAKVQSSGDKIAFSRFKDHQIRESYKAERCGYAVSGFMISFPHLKKIWYVKASRVMDYQNLILTGKPVPKSLNVEWFAENAVEIPVATNGIVDWHSALIKL